MRMVSGSEQSELFPVRLAAKLQALVYGILPSTKVPESDAGSVNYSRFTNCHHPHPHHHRHPHHHPHRHPHRKVDRA